MSAAKDMSEVMDELMALWDRFVTVRAAFPKARNSDLGKNHVESKRWYKLQGKHLRLSFIEPIDERTKDTINTCGYWVNQSFVIWLGSFAAEKLGVKKQADITLPGHEHVDLAIRLRNRLVHDIGLYKSDLPEATKTFNDLLRYYNPAEPDTDRYNLHIDQVLEAMFKGILVYVRSMAEREHKISEPPQGEH